MIGSSRVAISRSTARLARRLARPFSRRKLFRATRVMWPALAALTVTSIAHAQGTMDFSGATTLMTTFNMRPLQIERPVIFADRIQLVPEQTVATSGDQAAKLLQFMDRRHHRTNPGALQVGKEVLDLLFAPLMDQSISLRGWPVLAMESSNVLDARGDLIDPDCSVYAHGVSTKDVCGSCEVAEEGSNGEEPCSYLVHKNCEVRIETPQGAEILGTRR